jgi:hypothetical protein
MSCSQHFKEHAPYCTECALTQLRLTRDYFDGLEHAQPLAA